MAAGRSVERVKGGGMIDIGANLLDEMFLGVYRVRRKHEADLGNVLERAWTNGVSKIMVTAGTVEETKDAVEFCLKHDERLYCTGGVHPTRGLTLEKKEDVKRLREIGKKQAEEREKGVKEWWLGDGCFCEGEEEEEEEGELSKLREVIEYGLESKRLVALGETGLDFDRLFFCPRQIQIKHFRSQIRLAIELNLPLFLHNRSTDGVFVEILRSFSTAEPPSKLTETPSKLTEPPSKLTETPSKLPKMAVHSFTGSEQELDELLELGCYIGLNGCSLKTPENLQVAKKVPLDRIMLETDAPWCGIKRTHASFPHVQTSFATVSKPEKNDPPTIDKLVKDRSEPCQIIQVAEVIAHLKEIPLETLLQHAHDNTQNVFFT